MATDNFDKFFILAGFQFAIPNEIMLTLPSLVCWLTEMRDSFAEYAPWSNHDFSIFDFYTGDAGNGL
jgi:hypothetical protein